MQRDHSVNRDCLFRHLVELWVFFDELALQTPGVGAKDRRFRPEERALAGTGAWQRSQLGALFFAHLGT
jgi:hypothetical protein